MELGTITSTDIDQVRDAVSDSDKMKNRADRLLVAMREFAADGWARASWGIAIGAQENGVVPISTPFGEARARIEMSVGARGVQAVIRFEKAGRDEADQAIWLPAWRIAATKDGFFCGVDYDQKISLKEYDADGFYAEALLCLLYAIGKA